MNFQLRAGGPGDNFRQPWLPRVRVSSVDEVTGAVTLELDVSTGESSTQPASHELTPRSPRWQEGQLRHAAPTRAVMPRRPAPFDEPFVQRSTALDPEAGRRPPR